MPTPTQEGPKLLDQVRDLIRLKHCSIRTEQAYLDWIKRFILFHHKRHPQDMDRPEVEAFLTPLAVRENVAASTQNQALNAVLFLYRDVLKKDLGWLEDVTRAKRPARLPVVSLSGYAMLTGHALQKEAPPAMKIGSHVGLRCAR